MPRFAQPLQSISLRILCFSLPSLSLTLPCHSHASLCVSVAGPLLCDTTLCRAETVQIESMLCLRYARLSRHSSVLRASSAVPCLSATILCLSLRRGAVPQRCESRHSLCLALPYLAKTLRINSLPTQNISLPCQSNSQLCSSVACLCYTLPTPCHSNLCPDNAVRFISNTLTYFAFAFFLRNLSALPPTTEPSSPISSHTNAPLPLFRHWPKPLYFP